MSHFDNLPYVFELARELNNKCDDPRFALKYDEYSKYVKKFEELSDEARASLVSRAKERRKNQRSKQQKN